MLFNAASNLFQPYRGGQCTYPFFTRVLSTSTLHNILSYWLRSHIAIVERMDSGKREMKPVAITIINPRKEYWPSRRFEPATSCSRVFY